LLKALTHAALVKATA